MATWPDATKERGFTLYCTVGSLRRAHEALSRELRQEQAGKAPAWNTFRSWWKNEKWAARRAKVQAKVEEKTERSLADQRAHRLAQLGAAIDDRFRQPAAALRKARPGEVLKAIELEDKLRGGEPGTPERPLVVELWTLTPKPPKDEREDEQ